MKCRLCQSTGCSLFAKDTSREYLRCNDCNLIFVPDSYVLHSNEEKTRYALHDNTTKNENYINYLTGFAKELKRIPLSNPKVLDFGCGEDAVLTKILVDKGINCSAHDPLYGIELPNPEKSFDIIIMCEVIEHVKNIHKEVNLLTRLLAEDGYILIKTEFVQATDEFIDWWYTKDLTHINFFSTNSIKTLGVLLEKNIFYSNNSTIVILH